ncbi:hypothetical protein OM361_22965 [Escherichia albertii]|nr:hypothetical protein [Escherichia albertii]
MRIAVFNVKMLICVFSIVIFLFPSISHSINLWRWGEGQPRRDVTLDYWDESCSLDMGDPDKKGGIIPYFDCQSYLYGMLDAYISIRNYIPKEQRACFPDKITPWQVLQDTKYVFVVSPGRNEFRKPYNGDNTAFVEIIKELHKKYPCK